MIKMRCPLQKAEKAFLASSMNKEKLINIELEKIAQEINKAVGEGCYGIFYPVKYPENILKLKSMGYQIINMNHTDVRISWGNQSRKEVKVNGN